MHKNVVILYVSGKLSFHSYIVFILFPLIMMFINSLDINVSY